MAKLRTKIRISTALFFIGSYILALGPLTDINAGGFKVVLTYVVGGVFWVSHIIGYIVFISACSDRRKIEKNSNTKKRRKRAPGIVTFFSSRKACVADIILLISFSLAVVCIINPSFLNDWLQFIVFSSAIFFSQAHSIINGVTYEFAFSGKKKTSPISQNESSSRKRIAL